MAANAAYIKVNMIDEKLIDGLREYLKTHHVPSIELQDTAMPVMADACAEFICEESEPLNYSRHSEKLKFEELHSVKLQFEKPKPIMLGSISRQASDYIKKNRKPGGFPYALDEKRKEKNLSPAELYKKANVDRRLYSRLMGPEGRHPSMNTVISFAFALKLERQEFDELLQTAGFALSNSSSRDVCVMYCLEKGIYNIDDVNALLFAIGIDPLTRDTG